MMIWLDTETTGLDSRTGALLEVGVIVTDDDLTEIARRSWLVDCVEDPRILADDFVRKMHTENGLWDEWLAAPDKITGSAVVTEFLARYVERGSAPLCGNTISFDRDWIKRHLVGLNEFFHYRSIDVSTLKEVMRRVRPDVFESRPEGGKSHRVLGDLDDSIAEYRHYVEAIRVPLR